jgi:hypothetical protein
MSVGIRRVKESWFVEVRGQPIGVATTESEALQLAAYWSEKIRLAARQRIDSGRGGTSPTRGPLCLVSIERVGDLCKLRNFL